MIENEENDFERILSAYPAEVQAVTVTAGLVGSSNTNLTELAGVSSDAIRPLEGRFALSSKLGKGGMAEVFAARDSMLNREVAVKVLQEHKIKVGLARFVREAQVTAQLSHPNVVPVYGLEETDQGNPALTMKLIHGDTFAEYIRQCSAASGTSDYDHEWHGLNKRIEHFMRVCDAISYSHNRGVIHRDLKPGNFMIGAYGEVYVMDWGIARLLEENEDESTVAGVDVKLGAADMQSGSDALKTQVGVILGTPIYMSPEQGLGKNVGPKSDQFSLGMVLFEMLTFTVPREINGVDEAKEKIPNAVRKPFPDANQGESVPLALQAIVNRATSKDPSDRYPSVEEFSDDLRRYVHGEEVHARPDNLIRSWWRRVQRHPLAVMSALLISFAMAAGIATISLYRGLEAERVASNRGQILADLVAKVSQRANEFDTLLFRVESLLEGVAASSREHFAHAPSEPYPIYQPDEQNGINPPKDLATIVRYQQRVSFDQFVAVLSPNVELEAIQSELFQLGGLKYVFRDAMLRSARVDAGELEKEEADAILREGTPVHWAYVGLESGVMLNYPGNETYPADFDTLQRPWYVSAVAKKHGATWGIIYPDSTGSGYLMPCNQAFYDRSGTLLGVAGLDLSMDTVIDEMEMPKVAGVKMTCLLNDSGRVVLSSEEKGYKTPISMAGNKTKELSALGIPEVEEYVKKGTTSGFVIVGTEVLVFARLKALPWTLVAQVDSNSHGL